MPLRQVATAIPRLPESQVSLIVRYKFETKIRQETYRFALFIAQRRTLDVVFLNHTLSYDCTVNFFRYGQIARAWVFSHLLGHSYLNSKIISNKTLLPKSYPGQRSATTKRDILCTGLAGRQPRCGHTQPRAHVSRCHA